ncbi:POX domain [Macleaya cordata]|uniref:POX domain n=1 Tax=Macleaya cordata TaxID=56857 RepID=A0A200QNB9_MACCD|nr:POX domain [Macleaya cordata]
MASESRQEKVIRNLGSSSGFCYSSTSDVSSTNLVVNQMQSFESNQGDQLFNLTTGMEMLAFPSKNNNNNNRSSDSATNSSVMWKGFFSKQPPTSSNPSCSFYQTDDHQFSKPDFSNGLISAETTSTTHENLIGVAPDSSSWQDNNNNNNNRLIIDDSSLRCVFPSERVQSHQGLSLSLSSNKPSSIGLQSFEVRETNHQQHQHEADGFFGKSPNYQQQHQQIQIMQDGYLAGRTTSVLHQNQFQLKNSKYLVPAQELLNEFCNLGTRQSDQQKQKLQKINQLEDENGSGSSRKQSFLYSLDLLELQKRKTKLVSMLEEVDRRYRQYCDQMKAVVSSFEVVLGAGAASVYSALASKAMSKHFRCLRDGIVDQIKGIKKAMGEKDPIAPGTTRGETPRLRLLDQTLRQQRAFQQMSMMESHPWRPQRGLPERSVSVLRAWLFEHFLHPVRLWKPMVEEMYLEETKDQDNIINIPSSSVDWVTAGGSLDDNSRPNQNLNHQNNPQLLRSSEDQKPTPDQLVRGDSESLSSIINIIPEKTHDTENGRNNHQLYHHYQQQQQQEQQQLHQHRRMQLGSRVPNENFGVVDLDFASYNNEGVNQNNLGNGVSLTLGLQQHGGNGMSLSFSPVSQHSLFFPRDHIGDCDEQVQYSLLDGEAQNLPYRNLMGAQLLHDLAG